MRCPAGLACDIRTLRFLSRKFKNLWPVPLERGFIRFTTTLYRYVTFRFDRKGFGPLRGEEKQSVFCFSRIVWMPLPHIKKAKMVDWGVLLQDSRTEEELEEQLGLPKACLPSSFLY